MSSKNALAFAVGLGSGYMKAGRQKKEDERQAKDDEWRDEQRQFQREQQESARQERVSFADAVAPRTAVEGTAVDTPAGMTLYKDPAQAQAAAGEAQIEAEMRGTPTLAAARPAYGVTGTSLGNQITTEKPDVAALNSPDARMGRIVDATMRTDPAKAITLQNAALSGKKAQMDMDETVRARRKAIETEGLVKTVQASRSGDATAVAEAFNATGEWKVDGDLKVTPEKRKAPWGGEVETFTYTGTIKGPDGKTKPVRLNSLEAMTAMIPFKDMFQIEADIGKGKAKLDNDITLEGVRTNNNMREIGARGGQDRQTIDYRVKTGADKSPVSREERLRYDKLFSDAGRRMSETQRALSALQKDPLYSIAKPGTPQHAELQSLRDTIKSYGEERSFYQNLLAESQTPGNAKPTAAGKDEKPAAPIKALPEGAKKVGTANGRAVYETSDGKRFIQNN